MRERRTTSTAAAIDAGQLIDLIRAHQPVSAEALVRLLSDTLPATLSEAQKLARIHHQLRHLVDIGQIRNKGSRRYPAWGLADERGR
jgi:predicted transcriptional regulator